MPRISFQQWFDQERCRYKRQHALNQIKWEIEAALNRGDTPKALALVREQRQLEQSK